MNHRDKMLTGTGFERAAGYVAASADDSSAGIDEQVRLIDDWARRHQSTIADWHFDTAESACLRLAERPGGAALGRATQQDAYDAVVVSSLDVLGNEPEIVLDALQTITREGIPLMTVRCAISSALRLAWGDAVEVFPELGLPSPEGGEPTLN